MKVYLSLFKLKFINGLQYRISAIAGICTQIFFGFIFTMVYIAFYESNSSGNAPMQLNEVVSYLWLNQAFYALVYTWVKDGNLLSMIKNGNIAYELCRPIDFYKKWFFTMYGSRLSNVSLRFIPVLVVAFLLPSPYKLMIPPSLASFLLFLVSLFISSVLVTSLAYIFHVIVFFTFDEKGVINLMMVISEIFAGGVVPLAFFPNILQNVAYMLPFRYVCDLPFRIYTGNISVSTAIPDLIGGIVWTFAMIILGKILTSKAIKCAIVQGG